MKTPTNTKSREERVVILAPQRLLRARPSDFNEHLAKKLYEELKDDLHDRFSPEQSRPLRPHNTELSGEGPRPSARTSSAPILCWAAFSPRLRCSKLNLHALARL